MTTPTDNLTSSWLNEKTDADPWILHREGTGGHDAYLGNGLLGLRVEPDGRVSRGFMHGFWGASLNAPTRPEAIAPLPHFAGLRIRQIPYGLYREQDSTSTLHQELDLKQGLIRTTRRIVQGDNEIEIVQEQRVSRSHKHLTLQESTIRVLQGKGMLLVEESFDALNIPDLDAPEASLLGEDLCLHCRTRSLQSGVTLASRIQVDSPSPRNVFQRHQNAAGASAVRSFRLAIQTGESATITQRVAVVADRHADDPLAFARQQLDEAAEAGPLEREAHRGAWAELWEHRIEVDHPRLQQVLNALMYQMYCSLRGDEPFSHNPCGLSHNGWDGTIFWDTEIWTLPFFALFQPEMAQACLQYRVNTLPGALENARERGEPGARFAWQSAASGRECCTRPVFQDQRHINNDIAYGIWFTCLASGRRDFLLGDGYQVIRNCADHWLGLIQTDADGSCHIRHIAGSDEDAGYVDDNATTNWGAAWTLRLADRLCREKGEPPDPRWQTAAENLHIPMHPLGFPKQMEGWREDQRIKQADAVMLAYPWNYPMDSQTLADMVDYYRTHYVENAIMMGSAIDGMVDARLGRSEQAWQALLDMLPHLHLPWFHTTEQANNENGTFLTGIGGLLQLVCMGFAGLRVDEEGLRAEPCLPQALNHLRLVGINHQGKHQNITVNRASQTVHHEVS